MEAINWERNKDWECLCHMVAYWRSKYIKEVDKQRSDENEVIKIGGKND